MGTGMRGEGSTPSDVMLSMIEWTEDPSADATDLAAEASEVAVSTTTAIWEVAEARMAAVSRSLGWHLLRVGRSRRTDVLTCCNHGR